MSCQPRIPPEERPTQENPTASRAFSEFLFPVTVGAGGIVGLVGYWVAAFLIEASLDLSGPGLSYGQQAFYVSQPLCVLIGGGIGLGVALLLVRLPFVSFLTLALVSYGGWYSNNSLWNNQIARYGRDPSEFVLYYPPMAFSLLALIAAVIVGLMTIFYWGWRIASFCRNHSG